MKELKKVILIIVGSFFLMRSINNITQLDIFGLLATFFATVVPASNFVYLQKRRLAEKKQFDIKGENASDDQAMSDFQADANDNQAMSDFRRGLLFMRRESGLSIVSWSIVVLALFSAAVARIYSRIGLLVTVVLLIIHVALSRVIHSREMKQPDAENVSSPNE